MRGAGAVGTGAAMLNIPFAGRALAASPADSWPGVEALVSDYVRQRKVANMVCALGWGQREADFIAKGRDSFLAERMADPDSLYRIYSMTKPITGMAAMILVDEGRLSLDQPLADLLPKFADMQVQKIYDGAITPDNLERAVRPITIRHLLTHTAGLGYGSMVQQGPIGAAYAEKGLVPGAISRIEIPGLLRGAPAGSLAAFADRLAEMPLVYQPGTRWSYSVGLDLMGRVIEIASGQPFDAFLQERIFGPCGMASTWFRVPAEEKFRLTANYFLLGDNLLPIDQPGTSIYLDQPAFPFGGAGLVSSPRDYDRFLMMLAGYGAIDGVRVMSERAVRIGTSDLLPDTMLPGDIYPATYGFGAGGRVVRTANGPNFGWFGAAGTTGFVNMGSGLRQGQYSQYMPAQFYSLQEDFLAAAARDAGRR